MPKNLETIEEEAFGECTALKTITIPATLNLTSGGEVVFHTNSSLEKVIFEEGREQVTGRAFARFCTNVEIIIPKSVTKFSPWPFFHIKDIAITITFLGNAPEFVDEYDYPGDLTIYYDPSTNGWENCVWKDKFEIKPMS